MRKPELKGKSVPSVLLMFTVQLVTLRPCCLCYFCFLKATMKRSCWLVPSETLLLLAEGTQTRRMWQQHLIHTWHPFVIKRQWRSTIFQRMSSRKLIAEQCSEEYNKTCTFRPEKANLWGAIEIITTVSLRSCCIYEHSTHLAYSAGWKTRETSIP